MKGVFMKTFRFIAFVFFCSLFFNACSNHRIVKPHKPSKHAEANSSNVLEEPSQMNDTQNEEVSKKVALNDQNTHPPSEDTLPLIEDHKEIDSLPLQESIDEETIHKNDESTAPNDQPEWSEEYLDPTTDNFNQDTINLEEALNQIENETETMDENQTGIIAQSNNIISDKQKEEILREFESELESLFQNFDEIELLVDEDITFEEMTKEVTP
jgi:hypothetical protein